MKPFKKILVPVDFSLHSEEAIRIASDIADRYQGALTLVHVFEPISNALPAGFVLYTPPVMTDIMGRLELQLAAVAESARAAGTRDVVTRLLTGDAWHEIVRFAEEGKYDLIVMGTHGRRGIKHALLGSVAERVVRRAACAVLTVRVDERKK